MMDNTALIPPVSKKLPHLKLPTFSGKYSEYKNFINSFVQIIDREACLTNIEKFNHLRNCLTGQALETVQAFPICNENYPKALERLKTRYDNSTLIFLENITALFDLPVVSDQSSHQLRSLIDNVSALYGTLCTLGSEKQICEAILISLVMQRVDETTRRKWKEALSLTTLPSWNDCSALLDRHCQFLESLDHKPYNHLSVHRKANNIKAKPINRPKQYSFATATSTQSCLLCSSHEHLVQKCPRFKSMEVNQRFEKAKCLKLCINCLSPRHRVANCTSSFKCRICAKSHHTLLHQPNSNDQVSDSLNTTRQTLLPNNNVASHSHLDMSSNEQIILATALVLVKDSVGGYQVGRALLDSCSQVNFITEEFSKNLNLVKYKRPVHVASIGSTFANIKHQTSTIVKSRHSNLELDLNFCVTPHIAYQPSSEIDVSSWNLPPNTSLADELFFKSKRIDLLLGTESFFDILSIGQITLGANLPVLQKTLFGWVVSGRCQGVLDNPTVANCLMSLDDTVSKQLEMMWKIEEVQSAEKSWSPEQSKCETSYQETVRQAMDGRIVVRLPFKEPPTTLGLTRSIALRRLLGIERRLSSNPALKRDYWEFMKQYLELGHMTRVEDPKLNEPHYYIPHHCVLKPSSTSTKLRVVFDASCPTSSSRALNDILLVGPTIQPELYLLLLQFRLYRYALTADIVKMFRQILVDKGDRRFQYILWRDTDAEPVSTYELNTVTYGTASAPFLSTRSLQYLADKYKDKYPLGSPLLKSSFFVDDFIGGADSSEELVEIKHQLTAILKEGCFELDKWHSNHVDFVSDTTTKSWDLGSDTITSALGIKWHQLHDVFLFSFNVPISRTVTKRSILSLASSLFDPLGLLAPLVLVSKIIMQELWLLRLNWDESVPQALHSAWETFVQDLHTLSSMKIPRFCLTIGPQQVDIHGFCDASIRAYGCCIYLRSQDKSGNVTVKLFTAKSRVAPIKRKSLPKLELCGALLLARLLQKIQPTLAHLEGETFFWTDSQIVLHWLKQHSSTLSAFVGNRVAEIQDITRAGQWQHISTKINPADIVSRGCTNRQLTESTWFTGPEFLLRERKHWPQPEHSNLDMEVVNKERRKLAFTQDIQGLQRGNPVEGSLKHLNPFLEEVLGQIMGNLPIERVTPSRPFARTAVDFCGPVLTYLGIRGKAPFKTYIAIFVCLSTKAAHIEAVSDLTTDAFIAALKRLIGRRGLPSDIYCDNATNFVGASNKLADLKNFLFNKTNQSNLQTFCTNQFINFNFIPPRTPHFGGLWEAAVKIAKGHLNRTLANTRLTFEELGTVLIEIEAILNSRPISPLSCDPSDYDALTPAHFLIGGPLKILPESTSQYDKLPLADKWVRVKAVKHHFWRRWARDYLNELQTRTKWTKEQSNVSNGTLVIIHEDNMPPQRWLMGRIIHCVNGPDKHIRVVDLQTSKGVIRRPIHKLALLPARNPFKGGGMLEHGALVDLAS
ncbi:uncharacterized protein LOC119664542 [Teleopsis dalmanni]|uniref:uncharacterized protein LOC119664542 n=1 Tax=Teleopsis dalmanni TaxID=139649 RepID=UPI0018CDBC2A|nr:uncharacterized protein LOC119664542 [Teleopsis dalmanni]